MRTKAEIEKEIDDLERQIFFLDMKDVWDSVDHKNNDEMHKKLSELKKELNDGR